MSHEDERDSQIREMAVCLAAGLLANRKVVGADDRFFNYLSDNANGTASRIAAAAIRVANEIWERT